MTDTTSAAAPFYASFSSFKTLIGSLKANSVPGRIDRHVLKSFSNAVGSQLLAGLKFLGLINDAREPSQALLDLVEAHGTPKWAGELDEVLRRAYGSLFALNLATATPGQFNETFRKLFAAEGDTLRKASSFFLSAAAEAEVELSNYLTANKKTRSSTPRKKSTKPAAPKVKHPPEVEGDASAHIPAGRVLKPSEILLNYLKDMGPNEQEAAWVLMKHFASKNL